MGTMPRSMAIAMTAALAFVLLAGTAGCSGAKQKLVGSWVAATNAGKPGSLSDLTIAGDNTFLYAGKNAFGSSVRFGGKYTLGSSKAGPWIRMVYDDFPDRPIVWFYKVNGRWLEVSTVAADLKNGTAMALSRQ